MIILLSIPRSIPAKRLEWVMQVMRNKLEVRNEL